MACQPVGGLHLPLSDSDRIQDRPIGTINQHRALKFHLTATSLSSLDIYAPKLINPTNCCIRCFLVPHHVDEMPQIGPIMAQCKLLGPTCQPGQAASHLVFLSKQIRTRFLSTNQFNHPPPASTGPAKKASKVVHICFSLDLPGE